LIYEKPRRKVPFFCTTIPPNLSLDTKVDSPKFYNALAAVNTDDAGLM
jgi:hypothetical protein